MLSAERAEAMCEILDVCHRHVSPITLLKGISIAEQYYPAPYLRPMSDLDFLVDEAAIPAVEALLYELGYRQQSSLPEAFYDTHHHRMPFLHPQRGIWVEVHQGLFPSHATISSAEVFSPAHIATQLQTSRFYGRLVNRLSDALQVVYIAAHWGSVSHQARECSN
jgi:hypothetical protein